MQKNLHVISIVISLMLMSSFLNAVYAADERKGSKKNVDSMLLPDCDSIWARIDIILTDYKDWSVEQSAGISADLSIGSVPPDEWDALSVHFKSYADVKTRPQIVLRSAELSSRKFDAIDALSLRLKAGYGGHARVILRDKDGGTFFSKSPASMGYQEWSDSRKSYATDAVVFHGRRQGKGDTFVPKPPFSIAQIRLGMPAGYEGEGIINISNIGVFNRTSLDETGRSKSPYEKWLRKNCNYYGSEQVHIDLKLPSIMEPVSIGSALTVDVTVRTYKGHSSAILHVSVDRFGAKVVRLYDEAVSLSDTAVVTTNHVHEFNSSGFFAVTVSLSDEDGRLLARTSRSVMVWDPPGNAYQDDVPTFFGMMYLDRFSDTRQKDLALMAKAGVKIVRFPFRWSEIQVEKDRFVWKKYDGIMRSLKTGGFIAQPMVFYTPAWAARNLKATKYAGFAKKKPQWVVPRDPEEVAQFIGVAARRYKRQPVIWELYNEPTEPHHWIGGDVNDYVSILRYVSREVQNSVPGAGLITAGIGVVSAHDKEFLPFLSRNLDGVVHGLAVHAYGGEGSAAINITAAQEMIPDSVKDIGVWLNETGYFVHPADPAGGLRQSAVLAKTATISRFMGLENFSWFIFKSYVTKANLATYNYAMTAADGSVKQPILAYANAVRWLAGSQPVQKIKIGQGVHGYEFRAGSRQTLVTWLDDEYGGEVFQLPFKEGMALSGVYDMFGGSVDVSADERSINQKHYPLFLIYERVSIDVTSEDIGK